MVAGKKGKKGAEAGLRKGVEEVFRGVLRKEEVK